VTRIRIGHRLLAIAAGLLVLGVASKLGWVDVRLDLVLFQVVYAVTHRTLKARVQYVPAGPTG